MTLSFLRPVILAALTVASLASCGGKATFEIGVTVEGLTEGNLVLTETKSGQTITITDADVSASKKTFSFPNTIEYGTEYAVIIAATGQPKHQTCSLYSGSTGSAGRMASINVVIFCQATPHTVGGKIEKNATTTGSYAGLKLINGSNDLNPIEVAATTAVYSYAGVTYNTPYGITIFAQPTDTTVLCALVPTKPQPLTDTPDKVSGKMGDDDVVINVLCSPKPAPVPAP
jgi:hypothetical protein